MNFGIEYLKNFYKKIKNIVDLGLSPKFTIIKKLDMTLKYN